MISEPSISVAWAAPMHVHASIILLARGDAHMVIFGALDALSALSKRTTYIGTGLAE